MLLSRELINEGKILGETTEISSEVSNLSLSTALVYGEFWIVKSGESSGLFAVKHCQCMFQVLQTDGKEIKFLRNRGSFDSYPDIDDIAWVQSENAEGINPPTINSRGQHFF